MPASEIAIAGLSGSQVDVIGHSLITFNPDEQEAFGWTSATEDLGTGGDTALLITNVSTSKTLHIVRAYIWTDVHTAVLFTLPTFATFTGTAVVGVPLNRQKISVAPATAWAKETGNASNNVFARISSNELTTGQQGQWIDLKGKVQLGFRASLGIDVVENSAAFYSFVLGYYR